MKICIIIARYSVSGVPLAQLRLARALSSRGHAVDFLVGHTDQEGDIPFIPSVRVLRFNCESASKMLFPIRKYLGSSKPEVVFSAEDHLNAIVLTAAIIARSDAKISCSSRVTPLDTYSSIPLSKRWILKKVMQMVMWRADALTCISSGTVEEYKQTFKRARHVCAYNIIDDEYSRSRMEEPCDDERFDCDSHILIAAGALAPWKGYLELLPAIKILSNRLKVRLFILGDGPQRRELEVLINELGLENNVFLLGFVSNPLKYFVKSEVFVHSALVESLGNVLVEAMMCGCTPVSTDCPTGPREVLGGGKYGYLVPVSDPYAMAVGIERAINKPVNTKLLKEAIKPFGEEVVINHHFKLLGLELNQ